MPASASFYRIQQGFSQGPCVDAGSLRDQITDRGLDQHQIKRCNSFTVPRGREAGRGYLLMEKQNLDLFDIHSAVQVIFGQVGDNARTILLDQIYFVQAHAVTPALLTRAGNPDRPEAVYLVELADKRIWGRMSTVGVDGKWQVPGHGEPGRVVTDGQTFPPPPADWQSFLDILWGDLPAGIFGANAPAFPVGFTPAAGPYNFDFQGQNAWQAINDFLAFLGFCIVVAPNGAITITPIASNSLIEDPAILAAAGRLQDAGNTIVNKQLMTPQNINVIYPGNYYYYGDDADNTHSPEDASRNEPYQIEVQAINGTVAPIDGTAVTFWSDYPVLRDNDGAITNQADLDLRSAEIVSEVETILILRDFDEINVIGLLQLDPATEVSAITWRDYGDGLYTDITTSSRDPVLLNPSDTTDPYWTAETETEEDQYGDRQSGRGSKNTNRNFPGSILPSRAILPETALTIGKAEDDIASEATGDVLLVYVNNADVRTDTTKTVSLYNHTDDTIAKDTILTLLFDKQIQKWIATSGAGGSKIIRWKLQSDWDTGPITDNGSNGNPVEMVVDPGNPHTLIVSDPIVLWDALPMFVPLPMTTLGYATKLSDTADDEYEVIQAQCIDCCPEEPIGPVEPPTT